MKLANAAQMRELDRQAIEERGIASIDLMERAASGVAEAALSLAGEKTGVAASEPRTDAPIRIAALCGVGNNGGDGIAAARMLSQKGAQVRTFLVGNPDKLTPDAQEELRRLTENGADFELFDPSDSGQTRFIRRCDAVIDALFGVGLSRDIAPDSVYAAAVEQINLSHGAVVSADIPSGIDADTGHIAGCAVRADRTVTFSLMKIGHAVGPGAIYSGTVEVIDIGIPPELQKTLVCPVQTVDTSFVRHAVPKRKPDAHKGDFGKVLIVGGSVGYTGAPYLTASAAVHSGCGLVYMGVPAGIWAVEAVKCVSAMPFPLGKADSLQLDRKALAAILDKMAVCDVLALGPGLGRSKDLTRLVCELLKTVEKPVVLDADGINALEGHIDVLDTRRDRGLVTILTPHDGEFARLIGTMPTDAGRLPLAQAFAGAYGCTLVLKGHRTLTATPAGTVLVNTTGNSGLAKGGSGDILTGLIASLLAQGATPVQAAAGGVWIHGRAGDRAADILSAYAVTPADVTNALAKVFVELR